jgi:predicted nucleic acid-binding protein
LTLYLDASVIVPAFIDEQLSLHVRRFLGSLDGPPLLSDFAAGEFASAVARRCRVAHIIPD